MNPKNIITNPTHYTKWGIEPLDFAEQNDYNMHQYCILKYIHRYKYKNWVEDLKKARVFLDRLIKKENEKMV